MKIRPFCGIRPRDELAKDVIAPPYDVISEPEARALRSDNHKSFLRITRPEVDLEEGIDSHSEDAYQMAKANLGRFIDQGWLVQDQDRGFYLYSQTWQGRTQTGLMATCAVKDYDSGLIKKHELTRPDKEQDRVDHMEALSAQPGLVFLAYRDNVPSIKAAMDKASSLDPAWAVVTEDGVEHRLTPVLDPASVEALTSAFSQAPAFYIADGHHRSAAASRVSAARGQGGQSGWFLAGLFPDSELEILAYNRVVKDLAGMSKDAFLGAIAETFVLTPHTDPNPTGRGHWTMYLDGQWYGLRARPGVVPEADPVGRLDVAVLQNEILDPLLKIKNPRTDTRIQFVGGVRGHEALSSRVDSGEAAVAFHLFPTGLDQLFNVADADMLMPPKSTWFEPKLRGGVVMHSIASDLSP